MDDKLSHIPNVSVVIPTYNRALVLKRAVTSVLTQTYTDLEVIIVDDASTDNTLDLLITLQLSDPRIVVLQHPFNKGAQAARNTGIRSARGEWVAFLDSDDYWYTGSLEVRLNEVKQRNNSVVYSNCTILLEDGKEEPLRLIPLTGKVYQILLANPGTLFPALLVKKKALIKIGLLDESIVAFQEWDTSIRLAKLFDFAFVEEPTFFYDCRGIDTISKQRIRDTRGYEQVVKKHALAILINLGPLALSRHYSSLEKRYKNAGDERSAVRCGRIYDILWSSPVRKTVQLARLLKRKSHD